MSLRLVQTLHDALNRLAVEKTGLDLDAQASVLVQFAAGDWAALKGALEQAKADLGWKDKHAIADAAGVPSHSSTGSPLPVDTRLDLVAATLPAEEDTLPPVVAPVAPAEPEEVDLDDQPATTVPGELEPSKEQP